MKGRLSTIAVATVVVGLLVAACAPTPTPTPEAGEATPVPPTETSPPAAEKTLKVGVLAPFTGPNARIGDEFKGAVTMGFDAIDWTISDYKVEVVWIDSESDPEKATRAYEEAVVRDEIDAGLGDWHSSVAVAAMEVAARYKIPHFFGCAATEVINEKYETDPEKFSYWMGKTWPSPYKLTIAYVTAVEDAIKAGIWTPEEKKAAIYGEDTDWGRSFGRAIREDLEEAGWEVVGEDYYAIDEVEFYPLLKKLKDAEVRLLAGTGTTPTSWAAFVKQGQEVGMESLIVADGLGWSGEWYDLAGDASDYVLDQIPQWGTAEAKAFRDEFEEQWGFTPSPSAAGQLYDFTNFFIRIAERALELHGELSSETLYKVGQEELWTGKLTYTRADGAIMHEQYKYTPETIPDPVVGVGYYIFPVIQYFGGEGTIVWPDAWKEADVQVPAGLK